MKILIISSPRSGSTSLFNGLYKSLYNFKGFCEPFNPNSESLGNLNKEYSLTYPNLLVKILPWDLLYSQPLPIYFLNLFFSKNYVSFDALLPYILENLIKYSSNFDKIILLRRKNEIESSKSTIYSNNNEYHNLYFYDNIKYDYSEDLNFVVNNNLIIKNLSNELNISITYYEDLFTGNKDNIKNFISANQLPISSFENFYSYLDPKNRYRKN
jgi:hypothetical protein